ncbi:MAG: T9SS type A sorting domain-containing protein [Calditrichales bacterium]|nr:MAG: T9SS type A sorting domain-containing protein [Calditrichales bacterium]
MNRFYIFTVVLLMAAFTAVQAQLPFEQIISNFDSSAVDSVYDGNVEGAGSRIDMTDNHTDFLEGTGSLDLHYVIGEFHPWGSFGNLQYRTDGDATLDWSISDSLSLWIKVTTAPTHPENMVFRIHIADRPTPDDEIEEYVYEHATILDTEAGWVELRVPLKELATDGTVAPNDQGFVRTPNDWNQPKNNLKLDRDKIIGYNLSAIVGGWGGANNQPADSLKVRYDKFARFGARAVPFVVFNGKAVSSDLKLFVWGQSSLGVVEGGGEDPKTNALKWTQGNEWNNGWSGIGWDIDPAWNMFGSWLKDSLKVKNKAPEGTGAVRIQFESKASNAGKVGHIFTPTGDNQWHNYTFALMDFVLVDNTTAFDTSKVDVIGIMAEGTAVAGTEIFLDDWWTGNPPIDVSPPDPPTNLGISAQTNANLITWTDNGIESKATYNVYYSKTNIDSVNQPGIEVVERGLGMAAGTQNATHLLFSPNSSATVSFYYAVTCIDAAGNESDPVVTASSTSNTAKAIATIALNLPQNFKADGMLDDWANITPFRLFPSEGAHVVTNTTIDGDDDCSALLYIAIGSDSMYIAYDVTDDQIDVSATDSWLQDSPDLFIGLYNQSGKQHAGYERGAEPDYHFRFTQIAAIIDNIGGSGAFGKFTLDSLESNNYYWAEQFPSGYIVEGVFALADIADAGDDSVYTPTANDKIQFTFSLNDADNDPAGSRDGILAWSMYDDDTAYQSPRFWLYTWMTDQTTGIADGFGETLPSQYSLSQNYPNPFNPTTSISYTIAKPGSVTLEVFNLLGQRVQTLVKSKQAAGKYTVDFDATNLASGLYLYRLETEGFVKVQKMVLLK